MSLVNKMLRDLDARRAGAIERGSLLTAVSLLPEEERGKGYSIGLIVFVIVGVSFAAALQFNWPPLQALLAQISMRFNPPPPMAVPKVFTPAIMAAAPTPTVVEAANTGPTPPQASPPAVPAPSPVARAETAVSPAPTLVAPVPAAPAAPSASAEPPAAPVKPAAKPIAKPAPKVVANPVPKPAAKPTPAAGAGASATAALAAKAANVSNVTNATTLPGEGTIDKQMNRPPPHERADAEYRQGQQAQRQGSIDEALIRYRRALADQPEHAAARQALAMLLIEQRRYDEAEVQLRGGLEVGVSRLSFVTLLARLKVERGDSPAALDILLQHAAAGERSAEYQGFVAVLQNRAGRPADAAQRYRAATRLAPGEARWWVGLAMALEAEGKAQEAREAYLQARSLPGLVPELAAHIEQRLK